MCMNEPWKRTWSPKEKGADDGYLGRGKKINIEYHLIFFQRTLIFLGLFPTNGSLN